ncbi:MAG: ABC transporter substrate-binding protein [Actinomycetota bacterium]
MKRSPPAERITVVLACMVVLTGACTGGEPEGTERTPSEPIVVGSTLSLTGALAPTAIIHQITGDLFIERLNEQGGLLGRSVEWEALDDESDEANVSSLYERLITQEGVDLIMGPYATPNILAAMAVAERHGYVLPQHTAVLAYALTYDCQFPAWSASGQPNEFVPNEVFDALQTLPAPPETIAFLTNQAGSTDYISHGEPNEDDVGAVDIASERGYEVVLDVDYPPDISDWGPIASQVRDAAPDLVWMSGLAVDPVGFVEAFQQLDDDVPGMFLLFPAPGAVLGLGEAAEGALSVSIFEPNEAILDRSGPEVTEIVGDFEAAATEAGLPYTAMETQAVASWTAWEILVSGVEGADSLDHQEICSHLQANGADTTFFGHLTFDPDQNNFYDSPQGIKQVQDGEWVLVWPEDVAAAEIRELEG